MATTWWCRSRAYSRWRGWNRGCIRRFCGPFGVAMVPSGTSVLRLPSPLSVRSTALPARVGDAGGQPMFQGRWVVVTVRVTG